MTAGLARGIRVHVHHVLHTDAHNEEPGVPHSAVFGLGLSGVGLPRILPDGPDSVTGCTVACHPVWRFEMPVCRHRCTSLETNSACDTARF